MSPIRSGTRSGPSTKRSSTQSARGTPPWRLRAGAWRRCGRLWWWCEKQGVEGVPACLHSRRRQPCSPPKPRPCPHPRLGAACLCDCPAAPRRQSLSRCPATPSTPPLAPSSRCAAAAYGWSRQTRRCVCVCVVVMGGGWGGAGRVLHHAHHAFAGCCGCIGLHARLARACSRRAARAWPRLMLLRTASNCLLLHLLRGGGGG